MRQMKRLSMNAIEELSIEQLLTYHYHTKDDYALERLLKHFKYKVTIEMKAFYKQAHHYDDYFQEGMIGLYHAINNYNNHGLRSFSGFANLCIKRNLYNYQKHVNCKKHQVLNCAISFDHGGEYWSHKFYLPVNDPSEVVVSQDTADYISRQFIEALTQFEREVLFYHTHQLSHEEISHQVYVTPKSVDNAIQRIKQKFKRVNNKIRTEQVGV